MLRITTLLKAAVTPLALVALWIVPPSGPVGGRCDGAQVVAATQEVGASRFCPSDLLVTAARPGAQLLAGYNLERGRQQTRREGFRGWAGIGAASRMQTFALVMPSFAPGSPPRVRHGLALGNLVVSGKTALPPPA